MHIFIKNCCNWFFQRLNVVANLTAENIALRHQLAVLVAVRIAVVRFAKLFIIVRHDALINQQLKVLPKKWRPTILCIESRALEGND